MPTFNAYGEVCCCICNGTPVASAFALVKPPAKCGKDEGNNISFITFICGKHARDPEIYNITHDSGVFRRLLEFRKEVS